MSEQPRYRQAAAIIDALGAQVVANITGRDPSRVRRWSYPRARGGSDGLIPSDALALLWEAREAGRVSLSESHFFPQPSDGHITTLPDGNKVNGGKAGETPQSQGDDDD